MNLTARMRFACALAFKHLLICLVVGILSSILVYWGWYPFPYAKMLGVTHIFVLAVIADVICGPLLTLILSSPKKKRRECLGDFALIGIIQIGALLYALHSMYIARPVILAFEKDRYTVVSANEVLMEKIKLAPEQYRTIPFSGTLVVGTREPKNGDEFLASANMSLAGISPAMRPDWWVSIDENLNKINANSRPLSELVKNKDAKYLIDSELRRLNVDISALRYLPFTSTKEKEWIVIFEDPRIFLGYIPIDGFQ